MNFLTIRAPRPSETRHCVTLRPEQSVHPAQFGAGTLAFQDRHLLPQGQNLQSQIGSTRDEDSYGSRQIKDESEHELAVVSQGQVSDSVAWQSFGDEQPFPSSVSAE
jgi:hypothetical protein